jgi:acyl-CoA reductase-like NAD-dependent aldehyde dehydrogenase
LVRDGPSDDEELLGLVVAGGQSEGEVAPAAKETVYGLGAGIWTNNVTKVQLISRLKTGTVLGQHVQHFRRGAPVGGYQRTGWDGTYRLPGRRHAGGHGCRGVIVDRPDRAT